MRGAQHRREGREVKTGEDGEFGDVENAVARAEANDDVVAILFL